jgi:hypothetical protein
MIDIVADEEEKHAQNTNDLALELVLYVISASSFRH